MSEIRLDTAPDGVEDQVGEDLRLALLIAAHGAQRLMQTFTDKSRQREQENREATHRFQAELEAHKAMATAVTRDAGSERWWQESSPQQIAHAWGVARVWEGRDPELDSRAQALRDGLSDRYGISDPDLLTVRDLVAAQRGERAAQVASPLEHAEWEAREFGHYAEELARQREALTTDPGESRPDEVHRSAAGEAGTGVQEHPEWAGAPAEGLEALERDARLGQRHAEDRADRLRSYGAKPSTDHEWSKAWDTAERREALRTHCGPGSRWPASPLTQPARGCSRTGHRACRRGRRWVSGRPRRLPHGALAHRGAHNSSDAPGKDTPFTESERTASDSVTLEGGGREEARVRNRLLILPEIR